MKEHQVELTKEQKILLNLAAMSVSTTPSALILPKEELDGVDWKGIAEESMAQAIGLSAYDAAAVYKEYIPKEVYTSWKNGDITAKVAMEKTETKRTSFYKLVQMTESK